MFTSAARPATPLCNTSSPIRLHDAVESVPDGNPMLKINNSGGVSVFRNSHDAAIIGAWLSQGKQRFRNLSLLMLFAGQRF